MNNEFKKSIQEKNNSTKKLNRTTLPAKVAVLVLLAIFIGGNLPNVKTSAAGTITGTVFQDFNGNGVFDTTDTTIAIDTGVTGITVTAYDSAGVARGSTTSGANGTYSLSATGTGPYRVEFTGIPAGFQPSARSTDSVLGGTATNSGSTVQFVADGTTANVNLAINRPDDYCQNNPLVCIPQYYTGNVDGGSLRTFPYNYSSNLDGNINSTTITTAPSRAMNELTPTNIGTNNVIGTVFGAAWNRATRNLYTSAFIKRGAKLGALSGESPGAIYVRNNPTSSVAAPTLYVDLNSVFTGNPAGTNPHPAATTTWNDDSGTNPFVTKSGLGDLEISSNGATLYSVNMNDKQLYLIPTSGALNATTITRYAIPTTGLTTNGGTCPTVDVRPFALGRDAGGQIYVGAVCSAETAAATALAKRPFLHAYVWRFTLSGTTPTWTLVTNTTLNYARPSAQDNEAWTNGDNANDPELILADIEFERGNMILGFRDRNGDENIAGDADRGYGEILHATPNGTNWTVEANPATAEYYKDLNGDNREEGVQGALLQIPGFDQTLVTAYDAVAYNSAGTRISNFYTSGVQRYNNTSGAMTGAYDVYLNGETNTFRKANGMGDIEILCNSAPIEVGNRVWNDTNGNGVQDPNEAGIAGVTVDLYNGTTPVTYVRYRDRFDNIAYNGTNGSVDWSATPWTEIGDDGAVTTGQVQVVASGTALGNGLSIAGDLLGQNGISRAINLPTAGTLTFDYFRQGEGVLVQYSTNNGTNYTTATTIADGTDAAVQTGTAAIPANATNIRFISNGLLATSNSIYIDNIQITTNASVVTDANGEYYFSSAFGASTGANAIFDANIQLNTAYQLRFSGTPINTLVVTQPNSTAQAGNDDSNDSDVISSAGLNVINFTTGAAGSNDHTHDAGFAAPVSIGSTVFNDVNNNGLLNTGETGISGVLVQLLYDSNNDGVITGTELTTPVASINTDANGNYFFNGLTPGNYQVRIPNAPPTFTVSSTTTNTADSGIDNDDNGTQTGGPGGATVSPIINLTSGGEPLNAVETGQGGTQDDAAGDANGDMTVDFGFFAPASLGDFVFSDVNRNGRQDAGEPGIANVRVRLYDSVGTEINVGPDGILGTADDAAGGVLTNGTGAYLFQGLPPGTYSVGFTPPTGFGYVLTLQDAAAATDATDSDANPTTGRTGNYTLTAGQSNTTVDAGFVQTVSLGNQVYNDANNNGIRDAAEVGIVGVTVNLYLDANDDGAPDGGIIATTTTGANGLYLFSGLAPSTYIVGVVTPTNFVSSSVNGGDPDNNIDNDDNGVIVAGNETRSNPVTLTLTGEPTGENPYNEAETPDNSNNLTVDFGFTPNYSLGNRVWFDTNNDGQINAGEVGIGGVSVSVFASTNLTTALQTVNTDASGYYRFDNLVAGTYVVRINPTSFVNGGTLAGYQNTAGNNAADLDSTATAGQNGEDGINPTGAANTIQTNGISSNPVTLGSLAEPTGEIDVIGGTVAGQGTADNQANMTVDFGFYRMNLSGTVWSDNGSGNAALRNNGLLNSGEPGISNVTVRIYVGATTTEVLVGPDGILGTADDAAGGTITNASGDYNFQGLPPGDYRVVVNLPNGGTSSGPTVNDPNANVDNDDNGLPDNTNNFTGRIISGVITLTPAAEVTVDNATGRTLNPTVDFGFVFAGPTVVQLDKFDVYTDGNSVELKWSTGNETGNLGFNIYRQVDGKRELLNSAPIAGSALRSNVQLQASGNDYSWTDKNFVSNAVYYLEDLDINGSATLHGAVTPEFRQTFDSQPNAKMFSDLTTVENSVTREVFANQSLGSSNAKDLTAAAAAQQAQIAVRGGVKITVNHDGWYRVSVQQLQAAGFDTNSNSSLWQLFADGLEVPIKVNADSIEFFGHGLDTQLTTKQAYYLINNRKTGLRVNAVNVGGVEGSTDAQSFPLTVERKDRTIYFSGLVNGEENENWYGAFVTGSRETTQNVNAFNVDQNGRAHLTLKLQGVIENNHYVSVRFNDLDLGTVEFNGYENKQFDFDISSASVLEGANTVYLRANGGGNDISAVDSIRLSYQRGYTANNNRLRFRVPANQTVRVNGFTDANISVYEIRNGAAVQQIVGASENSEGNYGFSLNAANADREMIAVIDATVEQASVEANYPSALTSAGNKADFVIITANEVRDSADALASMREAQGLNTKVVSVDDIFDEFSFGRRDPEAIKQFLKTAATKWQTKPHYALLFGDASYDSRNNLGLNVTRDLVPTKMVDTQNLETSSDAWLADFDNDGTEDIALGRLPVGNASEAAAAIEKLARFDNQKERQQKTDVLVADTGFGGYSADLQTLLPGDVSSFRIDRGETTDAETHQNIIEQLNNNPLLVTYTGHGSTSVWATAGVFNSNDVATLNNSELSFYLLMNCLNGYIYQPTGDSLGETLFKSPNSAIAVWTSSGVTSPESQAAISQAFTNLVFNRRTANSVRVGDAVKAAKQATADSDVRRTWQLVGDPTVIIK